MKPLYYLKWPLILFIVGTIIRIIGALMKLRHWPAADIVLLSGTAIMVLGLVFVILKLTSLKPGDQPLQ